MSFESKFLFDDRESFLFGQVVSTETEFVEVAEALRKVRNVFTSITFKVTLISMVGLGSGIFFNKLIVGSSPAHAFIKSNGSSTDLDIGDELRKQAVDNRKFLGLKQNQLAQILGLSVSTIEKFEQEIYPTQSLKTKESLKIFNEWVLILKQYHGDRKFIIRPFIASKMNALGGLTPLEYAAANPLVGLRDLIGLERQMNG